MCALSRCLLSRASRRTVDVNGTKLAFVQHFMDVPVAQPRGFLRRADLTGLKIWPTALRFLERLQCSLELRLERGDSGF